MKARFLPHGVIRNPLASRSWKKPATKSAGAVSAAAAPSYVQTDQFGQPTTPYGDKLKSLVEAVHQHGMKLIIYFGYGLANTTPQMKTYHDQWTVWPLIPWSGGKPEGDGHQYEQHPQVAPGSSLG